MGRSRRRKLPPEPVRATITDLSHDGRGVAHLEGKTTFIHGALPGEEVMFKYTRIHKKHDEGEVVELLNVAAERVDPRCAHFGVCGGCSLQHQSEAAQIQSKQDALMDALQRIGKVQPEQLLPPLLNVNSFGYRRKARIGAKYVFKKDKLLVGFRERGTGYIADLQQCHVIHPKVGGLITALSGLIDSLSVREKVPQIELAMGDEQCVLVFRLLAQINQADQALLLDFGQRNEISIYIQESGPDSIKPLDGIPCDLSYRLPEHDITIRFLPNDFTQVNSELNRLMIDRAIDLLRPEPEDRLLDLFCGLGNFTLPLARRAGEVIGVEGNAGLVARARENARDNGITNTRYYTANLYDALDKEPWLTETYDKALLDPPRSGAFEVLGVLPQLGVRRILYVSCYPGTLARDAGELVHRYGYKLVSAGVMDMFPHTAHVESIALFEKV